MRELSKAQLSIWTNMLRYKGSIFSTNGILTEPLPLKKTTISRITCGLNKLIEENDILRARLRENGGQAGEVRQEVAEFQPITPQIYDFADEQSMWRWFERERDRPRPTFFDARLYGVYYMRLSGQVRVYIKTNYIFFDGFTLNVLRDTILRVAACADMENFTVLKSSYDDYLAQEAESLHSASAADDKSFWLNELKNIPPSLDFSPLCQPGDDKTATIFEYYLSPATLDAMRACCSLFGGSAFRLSLLVWYAVLCQNLRRDDLAIAYIVNNRKEKTKDTLGVCINTIPLVLRGLAALPATEAFKRLTASLKQGAAHGSYPSFSILEDLAASVRDGSSLYEIVISDISKFEAATPMLACMTKDIQMPWDIHADFKLEAEKPYGYMHLRVFPEYLNVSILQRLCRQFEQVFQQLSTAPQQTLARIKLDGI